MKFSQYPYLKPDITELSKSFEDLLKKFESSASFEEQNTALLKINELIKDFGTAYSVARVRYSLDTTNKKHEKDNKYFINILPDYLQLTRRLNELIVKSPFQNEYKNKYGKCLINGAIHELKVFSDKIAEEFKTEENLETQFYKIKAEGIVKYDGKEIPVLAMRKFTQSHDREIRKKSADAILELNNSRKDKISDIFDELVKVRTQMAHKLGYENFVGLGYERMEKEFTPSDAVKFRESVVKFIVPIASRLKERKRKRIGVNKLMYYDAPLQFKSGNPLPKGNSEWIIKNCIKMFTELSPETKEFINFMTENELMDLYSRVGKGRGGYSTYFYSYKAPFIMANMSGGAFDVVLFVHEAGHAFQSFLTRESVKTSETDLTSDLCEIHSMSMEFLTYDYMHTFFEEDTEKFFFNHLEDSINRITDMTRGDEFQEIIYSNPEQTNSERCEVWKNLQIKYMSDQSLEGNEFLTKGYGWQNRNLFFTHPFYIIEYALAQFVAYQFLFLKKENHENAIRKYIDFCKLGGNYTFSESLKIAGLKNPFDEETVKEMAEKVEQLLDSIDDSNF